MWSAGLMAAVLSAGCGGGSEVAARSAASDPPRAAPASPAPAAQEASAGTVSFTIDNRPKRFDSMPGDQNTYTPLASTITARASSGGEQLMITFMSLDLRKLEYPTDLPRPKTVGAPPNPLSAMAQVGFSYRDGEGREWAGPGRISLETFGRDGVATGAFSNVSLPHTGKKLPNITLDAGKFRVRISSPW